MQNTLIYRVSLGLTILLTLAAFVTLLGWVGSLINGAAGIPWLTVGLLVTAALNCTFRARIIVRRRWGA